MRMDQGNTMRPKPALYDAAFHELRPPLRVPVSGRHNSQNIHSPLGHTSTQKMRMDQGNTMRPKPALYNAAFKSYSLH